jgi:hypothetical protein
MKVFAFDPNEHAQTYRDRGWVHIRDGITPEFLSAVDEYTKKLDKHKLEQHRFCGKKEQALFDFPPDVDYDELYDVVATVCGFNRPTMTLSERHFQIYDAEANPEPAAHKDRLPSQVSVGLSIAIPEDSRLVLYPDVHREINPFNTSVGLRRSLQPDELPEVILRDAPEVELADRRGDVVMFPGSTKWHLRRRAANAVNLYLKFNDFGCDPLGEDPHTEQIRAASAQAAKSAGDRAGSLVPVLARQFDTVSRTYTRAGWSEVLEARVFGQDPFGVTAQQYAAIQAVDGQKTIDELAAQVATGTDTAAVRGQLVRLIELGALDVAAPAAEQRAAA